MDQQTVRKTHKCKLTPTPTQARELGRVLGLCRWLYNTALEQRIIAFRRAAPPSRAIGRKPNSKTSALRFQSTPPSIAMCYKMGWR
jgi:hypothetical protein